MRIISQDGCYDLPYEQTVVLREETHILVRTMEYEDLRIARYSTEEKAIKAMEMCRKGLDMFPFEFPKVFQFPADEEV